MLRINIQNFGLLFCSSHRLLHSSRNYWHAQYVMDASVICRLGDGELRPGSQVGSRVLLPSADTPALPPVWGDAPLNRWRQPAQAHSGVDAQTSTAGRCRPLEGFECSSLRIKTVHLKADFISNACRYSLIPEDNCRGVVSGIECKRKEKNYRRPLGVSRLVAWPLWGEQFVNWLGYKTELRTRWTAL